MAQPTQQQQHSRIAGYYSFQAKIYDLTRWTFLFGRNKILRLIPFDRQQPLNILEIGCGTGKNLVPMAQRFPNARLTGLDLSPDMLAVAEKKVAPFADRITLKQQAYQKGVPAPAPYDVILFSYTLTMIYPGYEDLIEQAYEDLKPGGVIAVVDFHDTGMGFYQKFMDGHHIHLYGQLRPVLQRVFQPLTDRVKLTYGIGIWRYLLFIGQKPENA